MSGQRVSLGITGSNYPSGLVATIKNPGGVAVGAVQVSGPGTGAIDAIDLVASGTYTIQVDPQFASFNASAVFAVYDLPTTTGSMTAGGPSVTASTTMPGENAEYTFSGSNGQHINLQLTNPSFPDCVDVYIYRPDGSTLGSVATCSSNTTLDRTLDVAGTHRIRVNPRNVGTGSVTLTLVNLPAPEMFPPMDFDRR